MTVAVPETPAAAPTALRPARLVANERADPRVAVLNHVRTAAEVSDFVRRSRGGTHHPVISAVTVYTDAMSAQALRGWPGLALDEDRVRTALNASDPAESGISAAVEEAGQLLATHRVAGVNISGLESGRGLRRAAETRRRWGTACGRRHECSGMTSRPAGS